MNHKSSQLGLSQFRRPLTACRLCNSSTLDSVVDLGLLSLSGVFPSSKAENPPLAPIEVLRCRNCGLGQLKESPPPGEMFGDNYGYRSGLNESMIAHLRLTARVLEGMLLIPLEVDDVVLDIGSNDGTLLSFYNTQALKVGIDPTASKFKEYYAPTDITITDFFSAETYWQACSKPAKIITSIAMFYDLPDPLLFCRDIAKILADDGLWHLEVSYTPWVLDNVAYDTICHEHLLYLNVTQLKMLFDIAELKIARVATNATNGGSVALTVVHKASRIKEDSEAIDFFLTRESDDARYGPSGWSSFANGVLERQESLRNLIGDLRSSGKRVAGLGASTKGNVLLQATGIGPDQLESVGEINLDKVGRFLPGSLIPIVHEVELVSSRPDFLLLLPWHFREGLTRKLENFLYDGGRLIMPLPSVEIVG